MATLVGVLLEAGQPIFLAWGADRTLIYNDAFAPLLGRKHPDALGRPFLDVWSETAADLIPLFDQVFAVEPVHMDHITLQLDRGEGLAEVVIPKTDKAKAISAVDGTTGRGSISSETAKARGMKAAATRARNRAAREAGWTKGQIHIGAAAPARTQLRCSDHSSRPPTSAARSYRQAEVLDHFRSAI